MMGCMSDVTQPEASATSTSVPGDLGWHLGIILRGYQTHFEDAVAGMPAGIRGFQVLSTVVHKDPANQLALGAHLAIDRTVLTYLLDNLCDAQVVERIPDPQDRRARKIIATAHGRKMLKDYEERVAAAEAELLAGLGEQDAKLFGELIKNLAGSVHRANPNANACEAMDNL